MFLREINHIQVTVRPYKHLLFLHARWLHDVSLQELWTKIVNILDTSLRIISLINYSFFNVLIWVIVWTLWVDHKIFIIYHGKLDFLDAWGLTVQRYWACYQVSLCPVNIPVDGGLYILRKCTTWTWKFNWRQRGTSGHSPFPRSTIRF